MKTTVVTTRIRRALKNIRRDGKGMLRLDAYTIISLVPISIVLAAFFIYPVAFLFYEALSDERGATLEYVLKALFDTKISRAYFVSFKLAFYGSTIQVMLAILMAFILRRQLRHHKAITTILTSPYMLSPVVMAQMILALYSPASLFPVMVNKLFGLNPPSLVFNELGVVMWSVITGYPFVLLFIMSAFASIDPSVEEAARTLGASTLQVFFKILIPIAFPMIGLAYAFSFMTGIAMFIGPMTVGDPLRSTRTIGVELIEQAFLYYNWKLANALGMVLFIIQFIGFVVIVTTQRRLVTRS